MNIEPDDMHDTAQRRTAIVPLGEDCVSALLSFALDPRENRRALSLARALEADPIPGVLEIVPSLVSVLVRYDPAAIGFSRLSGEIALRADRAEEEGTSALFHVSARFGGDDGPDLAEAAKSLGLTPEAFVAKHNATPLRVLATGFAPGFLYCGFHGPEMTLPRRAEVRQMVPAGSILFAAGQTALCATPIPTGWHLIGRTDFVNFDPTANPPTRVRAGDLLQFEVER